MITICFVYFKSLTLANLHAALHSVRQQDFSRVKDIVVLDNDTPDDPTTVEGLVDACRFPVLKYLVSVRHGDPKKTHSWSTNLAVSMARSEWVLFTRADFILDSSLLSKFVAVVDGKPEGWDGFVTSYFKHLHVGVEECEQRRKSGQSLGMMPGVEQRYAEIDTGVWLARRSTFDAVGGLDERLTAWGHAQTHFQHKLHERGVEFVQIPEVLYYHPIHGGDRDIDEAHRQLSAIGVDVKELWDRHSGVNPYR